MKYNFFTTITVFFGGVVLLGAKPNISLAHFEKDLQSMLKKSQNLTIKTGSFVDCLADKRRKKEVIEQEISRLEIDVAALNKEIAFYEVEARDLTLAIEEQKNKLKQRMNDMNIIIAQINQTNNVLTVEPLRDS